MKEDLIQRLCWNPNGYQFPAGETLEFDKGFAGKHGFGYEEWNFNTNDIIEGFCYGYIYQTPKAYKNKKYNIWFFTKDKKGSDFLIGLYKNAEFINEDQRNRLRERFKQEQEIYLRRKQELKKLNHINSLSLTSRQVENYILGNTDGENYTFPLNIKVKPSDIILLEKPIPIKMLFKERLNYHYTTAENISKKNAKLDPLYAHYKNVENLKLSNDDLSEICYSRNSINSSEKLITPLHKILSNKFKRYLLGDKKFNSVEQEDKGIDIIATKENEEYMFELKIITTPYARHAIREALGQLLEYNYYPTRTKFKYMNIVINRKPSNEEIKWCKNLNKQGFKFELYWQHCGVFENANLLKNQ